MINLNQPMPKFFLRMITILGLGIQLLILSTNIVSGSPDKSHGVAHTADERKICDVVISHFNNGSIVNDLVRMNEKVSLETLKKIPDFFNHKTTESFFSISMLEGYWNLDLNGDGVNEHVAIISDGTAHYPGIYIRSQQQHASLEGLDSLFRDEQPDFNLISINGEYYFIASHHMSDLGSLWRFSKAGEFEKVPCSFLNKNGSVVVTEQGRHLDVCKAVANEGVKPLNYIKFTQDPGNIEFLYDNIDPHFYYIGKMAKIDINNDGREEDVISISGDSSAGRGCTGSHFAVVENSPPEITKTALNDLLLVEIGGGSPCGVHAKIFVFNGETYIDSKEKISTITDRRVYKINGDNTDFMCRFLIPTIY
ncbi:MAG: hypothetical protein HQL65_09320 [Magnetococcales bacterium]|nr:hypothetical protein [Magnetococcales bacterium]